MWTTLFPLALAASIWLGAVNLAVQLDKGRAAMMAASQATFSQAATSSAGPQLD